MSYSLCYHAGENGQNWKMGNLNRECVNDIGERCQKDIQSLSLLAQERALKKQESNSAPATREHRNINDEKEYAQTNFVQILSV